MKLSINKISIIFAILISVFIAYVQYVNREEFIVQNNIKLKNHIYADNFVLNVNNLEIKNRTEKEYNAVLYGLLQNSFDVNFQTEENEVILKSPYFVIHLFYSLSDTLMINKINIKTTNKKYCEN